MNTGGTNMKIQKIISHFSVLLCLLIFLPHILHADPLDNWHWRNPLPTGNPLFGVTYGKGTFVAVGDVGTILTSPDGVTWTERSSGMDDYLTAIAYGEGTFVAAGLFGTILTSPDGVTWTQRFPGTTAGLTAIAHGNNSFVAVGSGGTIIQSDPLSPQALVEIDFSNGTLGEI